MTKLTTEQLEAIQARCDAATEGLWGWSTSNSTKSLYASQNGGRHREDVLFAISHPTASVLVGTNDAVFIAASRTDVPVLLSHIEAQAAEIAETRETTIKECFDYLLSAAANNYGKDQKKRDVENEVVNAFAKQMLNDLASEDMRVEWKSQEDHQTEIAEKDARIKELEGSDSTYDLAVTGPNSQGNYWIHCDSSDGTGAGLVIPEDLARHVSAFLKHVDVLTRALKWYASEGNWTETAVPNASVYCETSPALRDRGKRAAKALRDGGERE